MTRKTPQGLVREASFHSYHVCVLIAYKTGNFGLETEPRRNWCSPSFSLSVESEYAFCGALTRPSPWLPKGNATLYDGSTVPRLRGTVELLLTGDQHKPCTSFNQQACKDTTSVAGGKRKTPQKTAPKCAKILKKPPPFWGSKN